MLKKKWLFLPVIGIFILGVILGSFFDLQINQAIYDRYNWFGLLMSAVGEFPVYSFLGVMAAGFVFLCKPFAKVWQRIVLIVLAVACIGVSIYFQGDHVISVNSYNKPDLKLLGYAIAAVLAGLGYLAGYFLFKYSTANPKQILIILLTIIVIYGVAIGINQLIKPLMARPRSRFLFDTNTVNSNYRNWWENGKEVRSNWVGLLFPNGEKITKEEFRSFPSGHMANISMFVPMFLTLPLINKHIKLKEEWIIVISTAWCLLLAYSRMRVGAHYLSDVSVGGLTTVAVAYVGSEIFAHVYKKYGSEQIEAPQE